MNHDSKANEGILDGFRDWAFHVRFRAAGDETAKFNGKWKGIIQVNGQSFTMESIHDAKGYKNYVITPAGSSPAGDGTFSAADGKWTAVAANGSDSGTYQFIDANTVYCKDVAGNVVLWQRDDSALPPVVNPAAGNAPFDRLRDRRRGPARMTLHPLCAPSSRPK